MYNIKHAASCVLIVSSCDAYQDAWHPFFTLLFRYWPDCPFKIYLISNEKKYEDERVETITVGKDRNWAGNLLTVLKKINTKYFLYLQEDYFLRTPVDTAYILKLVEFAQQKRAGYLRLVPWPAPDIVFPNDLKIGEISAGQPYRYSNQAYLGDREAIISILRDNESGWMTEVEGSRRTGTLKQPFFSVTEPVIDYLPQTGIVRGKWMPSAVKLCKQEGIKVDFNKRGINYAIDRRKFWDSMRKRIKKMLGIIS